MNWYLSVLKNYAGFDGRARRKEFWLFTLISFIIYIVLAVLDNMLFGREALVLFSLYSLAVMIPTLAVSVRRLHDTDRSGWWVLLSIIPLVSLVLLVFFCLEGTRGDNRFGSDPKA